MTRIQFSFLGRSRLDPHTGYPKARYRLPDRTEVETAFVGVALARAAGAQRLDVLGTPGSMWSAMLEASGGERLPDEARLALIDASERERVDAALLASFEPAVSAHCGLPVRLRLIGYAEDEAQQLSLLRALADWVQPGDELVLDVTHGLRHLPMLMLAAAHYLERVRRVTVRSILYGAVELRAHHDGVAPVLDLTGLLRVLDGVQALSGYDASGDYGELADIAGRTPGRGEHLRRAAFFERTTNPVRARQEIAAMQGLLRDAAPADPLGELFEAELGERLAWARSPRRHQWEAALARESLGRRDYLRAAIYAQEALISATVDHTRIDDYEMRESCRLELQAGDDDARRLFRIRNAMAHGLRPADLSTRSELADEKRLAAFLRDLLRRRLPG